MARRLLNFDNELVIILFFIEYEGEMRWIHVHVLTALDNYKLIALNVFKVKKWRPVVEFLYFFLHMSRRSGLKDVL